MSFDDVVREKCAYDDKAKREQLRHACEICKLAEGVRFTDYQWTCEACRERYLLALLEEGLP